MSTGGLGCQPGLPGTIPAHAWDGPKSEPGQWSGLTDMLPKGGGANIWHESAFRRPSTTPGDDRGDHRGDDRSDDRGDGAQPANRSGRPKR